MQLEGMMVGPNCRFQHRLSGSPPDPDGVFQFAL